MASLFIHICHSLGKFSRWQIDIFSYFYQENTVWHFMKIVSFLWRQFSWNVRSHFLGKIRKTIFMKCLILFSGKNKNKNVSICHLFKILPGILSVKFCEKELSSWSYLIEDDALTDGFFKERQVIELYFLCWKVFIQNIVGIHEGDFCKNKKLGNKNNLLWQ